MDFIHSDHCVGCLKTFKRLLTHLAQNAVCASHYAVHDKSAESILSIFPNDDHLNTSHVSEGATCSRLNVSSSSCCRLLLGKERVVHFLGRPSTMSCTSKMWTNLRTILWSMMTRYQIYMVMIRMYQKVIMRNVKLIIVFLICMRSCVSYDQTRSVLSAFLGKRRSKLSYCNSYGILTVL